MADKDREKWDSKYLQDIGNLTPSKLLEEFIDQAPLGKALDIACGNGRNSIFLKERGFTVDAIDISTVATQKLSEQNLGINVKCMDIDSLTLPENSYDAIINIRFLERRLFPIIEKGLKPGGLLLFESFAGGKNEKFCLTPNELLHAFPTLHIIYYKEQDTHDSDKFAKSVSFAAIKNGSK